MLRALVVAVVALSAATLFADAAHLRREHPAMKEMAQILSTKAHPFFPPATKAKRRRGPKAAAAAGGVGGTGGTGGTGSTGGTGGENGVRRKGVAVFSSSGSGMHV